MVKVVLRTSLLRTPGSTKLITEKEEVEESLAVQQSFI